MKNKRGGYSWEDAGAVFQEDRIVIIPIDGLKKCNLQSKLPYVPDIKEKRLIDNMISEQCRTLMYSLDMLLDKFSYLEKVGRLKFESEEAGKNYCFGVLWSEPTWRTGFALFANDWGQGGVSCEQFPYEADGVEKLFWDSGKIISYQLSKDDLLNGVVCWVGILSGMQYRPFMHVIEHCYHGKLTGC